MEYRIYDKVANQWVSYPEGMLSSDCWTCIKSCANRYTLTQAIAERLYMAKICKINRNDLVIEQI